MEFSDSQEVQKFLSLFSRVREACDDDPLNLAKDIAQDPRLRELCSDLYFTGFHFQYSEKKQRRLFLTPANPTLIKAWRDYEDRYRSPLAEIMLQDIFDDVEVNPEAKSKLDLEWEFARENAREEAHSLRNLIDHGRTSLESGLGDDCFEDGPRVWETLVTEAGIDIEGVLTRRELVPFVLIPRHVAAKESGSSSAVYNTLQQAQDAFIFGTPLAAIALMRSLMEALIRDHYGAQASELAVQIDEVSHRLPKNVPAARLHSLRKLANSVLHLDRQKPDDRILRAESDHVEA